MTSGTPSMTDVEKMEMVEQVARAICDGGGFHAPYEKQSDAAKTQFRTMARAAIAALSPELAGTNDHG